MSLFCSVVATIAEGICITAERDSATGPLCQKRLAPCWSSGFFIWLHRVDFPCCARESFKLLANEKGNHHAMDIRVSLWVARAGPGAPGHSPGLRSGHHAARPAEAANARRPDSPDGARLDRRPSFKPSVLAEFGGGSGPRPRPAHAAGRLRAGVQYAGRPVHGPPADGPSLRCSAQGGPSFELAVGYLAVSLSSSSPDRAASRWTGAMLFGRCGGRARGKERSRGKEGTGCLEPRRPAIRPNPIPSSGSAAERPPAP